MLGQRKMVLVSGISPLIASSLGGSALLVAISIAAEDERPSAHTVLRRHKRRRRRHDSPVL